MVSSEVIKQSGIAFGTSGARGLVEDFTDEVCVAFTVAFIKTMQTRFQFDSVCIGIDRRPSSPKMAAACCAAIKSLGLKTNYFGILPTPALALESLTQVQPAIVITGSHIPFDRNGIKFYRPDGEISKQDEQAILTAHVAFELPLSYDLPVQKNSAQESYLERNKKLLPENALRGKRVGIYEHSSAGRALYTELFQQLGAEVISLGRSEEFVPIDTEAVTQDDRERAKVWSKEHQLDFLFSTDGDGDRPLIADEKGHWLRGDIVGLLTARYLSIEALAVPVSCNTAIELSKQFKQVMRTKIGSPYVIEWMSKLASEFQSVAGFEANGGFLLETDLNDREIKALPTRDALLPVIATMALSLEVNKPLSEIVKQLPNRFTASDRLQSFPTERSQALIQKWSEDPREGLVSIGLEAESIGFQSEIDGLRWQFETGNVVHLRPSGNAPEFRCYTEASTVEQAQQLLNLVLSHLTTLKTLK